MDTYYTFDYLPWGINCAPFMLGAGMQKAFQQKAEQKPEMSKDLAELAQRQYADDFNSGGGIQSPK
jgi:uncharacterized protein YgfB (UPF0149 family)